MEDKKKKKCLPRSTEIEGSVGERMSEGVESRERERGRAGRGAAAGPLSDVSGSALDGWC